MKNYFDIVRTLELYLYIFNILYCIIQKKKKLTCEVKMAPSAILVLNIVYVQSRN